jgi:hypothetical protein
MKSAQARPTKQINQVTRVKQAQRARLSRCTAHKAGKNKRKGITHFHKRQHGLVQRAPGGAWLASPFCVVAEPDTEGWLTALVGATWGCTRAGCEWKWQSCLDNGQAGVTRRRPCWCSGELGEVRIETVADREWERGWREGGSVSLSSESKREKGG